MRSDLDGLFSPRSVAVFGASRNPRKFGNHILSVLRAGNFPGEVYPVNREAEEINGYRCVASGDQLPEIDLAVLVVPAAGVIEAAKQAIAAGATALVVITGGFSENGPEGAALERDLVALVREHGIRLLGPNCEGFVNVRDQVRMSFSLMFTEEAQSGGAAIVSQSGAYSGILYDRLRTRGQGLSLIVSSGNEADTTTLDLCRYLAGDDTTDVILVYMEQSPPGDEFYAVMREITAVKPVVLNKSGRTAAGSSAAATHTGALAVPDRLFDALCRQAGVVRAHSLDELTNMSLGLARWRRMSGDRVGIISLAGGLGVEMTDLVSEAGMEVPELAPDTVAALREILPSYAVPRNPVDLAGLLQTEPRATADLVRIMREDQGIDAVVLVLTAIERTEIAEEIARASTGSEDKPLLAICTGGGRTPAMIGALVDAGVPYFESTDQAVLALRAIRRYSQIKPEVHNAAA